MKKLVLLMLLSASGNCLAALDCDRVMTTPDINECARLDFEKADKELNAAYKIVINSLSKSEPGSTQYRDTKNSLIAAQRLWISFRDKDCNAVFNYWRDGTIRTGLYLACKTDHTKLRTKQLQAFLK
jgi:uncharacterized protein YecT (DUF1311 family)